MSNYNSNLSFGLKFDSDENSSQGDGSQYGTETAAAMIGSLLGGQKGECQLLLYLLIPDLWLVAYCIVPISNSHSFTSYISLSFAIMTPLP